ncbi:MAG: CoA transferase [Rhodospirillales bacterium]|nr:CoA transferase [Rhodospirillales bacterium]
MHGPLAGLRVVELAHIMAGPVAGLMLADMGADVVKVEKLPGGDDTRRMVPPRIGTESAAYLMMNRNKRGIALDLKQDAGKDVLRKLLGGADVLIENYRLGTLDRLGFGWDAVHALNPRLVYCSLSGFGRTGPYAARGGFDLVAQGMSGLMSVTGEGPGRAPVKVGAPVSDITAGILAATGILAALQARNATGKGQLVDTSLFEAGIVQTFWQSAIALATGTSPGPLGSAHPLNAPYQAFATSDGWINVGAANQAAWLKLVACLDAPGLAADPRYASNAARMENLAALVADLEPLFAARTTARWLEIFEAAGMPAGPVLSISEMLVDPQTCARGMVVETDHPVLGRVATLGPPVKFSATPASVTRHAPLLGQHTSEVLGELGYASAEIDALAASGAVATC